MMLAYIVAVFLLGILTGLVIGGAYALAESERRDRREIKKLARRD